MQEKAHKNALFVCFLRVLCVVLLAADIPSRANPSYMYLNCVQVVKFAGIVGCKTFLVRCFSGCFDVLGAIGTPAAVELAFG